MRVYRWLRPLGVAGLIMYAACSSDSGETGDIGADSGAPVVDVGAGDAELASCEAQNQPCADSSYDNSAFVCDRRSGVCLTRCSVQAFPRDPGLFCPPQTYCALADPGVEPNVDASSQLVLDGGCFPSACASNFDEAGQLDPSICVGQPADFADFSNCGPAGSCMCNPVANQMGVCSPVGDKEIGESCNQSSGPFTCRFGLTCMAGICVELCDPESDACTPAPQFCPPGATCGCEAFGPPPAGRPSGVCAMPCSPASLDACGAGFSCRPIAIGTYPTVADWFCTLDEESEAIPLGEQNDECFPGRDAERCVEGLSCAASLDDGIRRCQPVCAPAGGQPASLDRCDAWGESDVCVRTGNSNIGLCSASCDPDADGAEPGGCADGSACRQVARQGADGRVPRVCVRSTGNTPAGERCQPAPDLGAGSCADGLSCVFDGSTADFRCRPPCDPHGDGSECGEGTYCGGSSILSDVGAGACLTAEPDTSALQPCSVEYSPCAAHGTTCQELFDLSTYCLPVCRLDVESDCGQGEVCARVVQPAPLLDPNAGVCVRESMMP